MACDYAINPMLLDAGLTLPKDVLLDDRFRGMSAERIYNLLEEEEQNPSSSSDADTESQDDSADSGGGSNSSKSSSSEEEIDEPRAPQTPGGIGQVLDAPEPENGEGDTVAEQAREWQIAVEQAENVAKLAGKLPAGVTRSLEAAQAADVTGGSCCVAPGRRPFRPTTVGPVPTVAMSGTVSTCQASSAKVSVRLHRGRLLRLHQRTSAWAVRGRGPLYPRGSTASTRPCSVLRYRGAEGGDLPGRIADQARAGGRRWNGLRPFPLAGRAGHHAADVGLSYRSVRHIPKRRAAVPGFWASTGSGRRPSGRSSPWKRRSFSRGRCHAVFRGSTPGQSASDLYLRGLGSPVGKTAEMECEVSLSSTRWVIIDDLHLSLFCGPNFEVWHGDPDPRSTCGTQSKRQAFSPMQNCWKPRSSTLPNRLMVSERQSA